MKVRPEMDMRVLIGNSLKRVLKIPSMKPSPNSFWYDAKDRVWLSLSHRKMECRERHCRGGVSLDNTILLSWIYNWMSTEKIPIQSGKAAIREIISRNSDNLDAALAEDRPWDISMSRRNY